MGTAAALPLGRVGLPGDGAARCASATDREAQIWINHPGEMIQSGYGRPSYWGGCGTLPRVQQYRGLAVVVFDGLPPSSPTSPTPGSRAPPSTRPRVDGDAAFARCGDGARRCSSPTARSTLVDDGPTAGCELRLAGRHGRWIVRLGATGARRPRRRFRAPLRRPRRSTHGTTARIVVDDPDYGEVEFRADGTRRRPRAARLDPRDWTIAGEATRTATIGALPVNEAGDGQQPAQPTQ